MLYFALFEVQNVYSTTQANPQLFQRTSPIGVIPSTQQISAYIFAPSPSRRKQKNSQEMIGMHPRLLVQMSCHTILAERLRILMTPPQNPREQR